MVKKKISKKSKRNIPKRVIEVAEKIANDSFLFLVDYQVRLSGSGVLSREYLFDFPNYVKLNGIKETDCFSIEIWNGIYDAYINNEIKPKSKHQIIIDGIKYDLKVPFNPNRDKRVAFDILGIDFDTASYS
jgi:hypothetical protein